MITHVRSSIRRRQKMTRLGARLIINSEGLVLTLSEFSSPAVLSAINNTEILIHMILENKMYFKIRLSS